MIDPLFAKWNIQKVDLSWYFISDPLKELIPILISYFNIEKLDSEQSPTKSPTKRYRSDE